MPTQQNTPATRRISVCSPSYIPFKSRRKPHPVLRLSGPWLQEIGFNIGKIVEIACEKGRLTITIAREQQYEQLQARFQREKIEIV